MIPAEEADAHRIAEIERDAYSVSPFSPMFFPGPFPADALDTRAAGMVQALRTDPTTRWWKVVDPELGGADAGLVAFAQWHVYTGEARQPEPQPRTFGPGTNVPACEALFGGISEMRYRLMGRQEFLRKPPTPSAGRGRCVVEVLLTRRTRQC
jgi:hypothetical protein